MQQKRNSSLFNKTMSHQYFQNYYILKMEINRRTRNNKLESIRNVFETWSQYLQDGYVPGL